MATFKQLCEGLTIFAKYGMKTSDMGIDKERFFCYMSQDAVNPDSEDGKKLQLLGFQPYEQFNNKHSWSIVVNY